MTTIQQENPLLSIEFWQNATTADVQEHLNSGTKVNVTDANGQTPLHHAAKYFFNSIPSDLLAKATLDARDRLGNTALHVAAASKNTNMIEALVKAGVDVDILAGSNTPLCLAAFNNNGEAVRKLVELGADIEHQAKDNRTPLHIAARQGNCDAVKILLELGANSRARDKNGETPLDYAKQYGSKRVQELLQSTDNEEKSTLNKSHSAIKIALEQFKSIGNSWVGSSAKSTLNPTAKDNIKTQDTLLEEGNMNIDNLDEEELTPLLQAIIQRNVDAVKQLLDAGADIEVRTKCEQQYTPLHLACKHENIEIITLLLLANADIEAQDHFKGTPLHTAAYYENRDAIRQLLQARANKEARGYEGRTPLHYAARNGRVAAIEILHEAGAKINPRDDKGRTPLIAASRENYVETMQLLIELGADLTLTDNFGAGVIAAAVSKDDSVEAIKLLLNKECDIDTTDINGNTPLIDAAAKGFVNSFQILLETGASVSKQNNDEKSALDYASEKPEIGKIIKELQQQNPNKLYQAVVNNDHETVWKLIEADASLDLTLEDGKSILHLVATHSRLNVFKLLFNEGITEINTTDKEGNAPLHEAAEQNNVEIIAELIKRKADIDLKNYQGYTPLHVASRHRSLTSVTRLIEAEAKLDIKDEAGWTPLHISLDRGFDEVAVTLIKAGADVQTTTNVDETPLDFAIANNCFAAIKALIDHNVDVRVKDEQGNTPLHNAARSNSFEAIKLLIEAGADKEALNDLGRTPLHHCAKNDCIQAIHTLLDNGASPNVKDNEGWTPLHLATIEVEVEAILVLLTYSEENSAEIYATDNAGLTPLHLAATEDKVEAIKALLENGASIWCETANGDTPIDLAPEDSVASQFLADYQAKITKLFEYLENSDLAGVRELINEGVNINETDSDGRSALQVVTETEPTDIDLCKCLLEEFGADPNVEDTNGQTPLLVAVARQDSNLITALLSAGADTEATDSKGRTPLQIARARDDYSTIHLLLEHGAERDAENPSQEDQALLIDAVRSGEVELVDTLLGNGANIDEQDENGWTLLHLGARYGSVPMVELLLHAGASPDLKTNSGYLPYNFAKINYKLYKSEVLKFLKDAVTPDELDVSNPPKQQDNDVSTK